MEDAIAEYLDALEDESTEAEEVFQKAQAILEATPEDPAEINRVPVSNRTKKNAQILITVAAIEQIKARTGIAYSQLLRQAGIGYGQFMRWKRRITAGQ